MNHHPHLGQVLLEREVGRKLEFLDSNLHALLRGEVFSVPDKPGRDVQIVPLRDLPAKKGLSTREGQARLLHDLASIELQAMELGLRTLVEFPEAPETFRAELCAVTRDEGRHLGLCVQALDELGFPWGSFPTHDGLWRAVRADDSLLDRILIVHRYLEGSGLDASHTILRRLAGVQATEARRAVEVIGHDEVAHVQFGSRWYHKLVRAAGLDPDEDFRERLIRLIARIPRRLEPINEELRLSSGFTPHEIEVLQVTRTQMSGAINSVCADAAQ